LFSMNISFRLRQSRIARLVWAYTDFLRIITEPKVHRDHPIAVRKYSA
jgi:hypothetical protein